MTIRVAINGFGRMGRLGFRAAWGVQDYDIVHINEISADAPSLAHLLKYDSVHGRWDREVGSEAEAILVDGKRVSYSMEKDPARIDWAAMGVDIVIEATGKLRTAEQIQPHFDRGAKKVIVAAPVKGALNIVMGVNDHLYDPATHHLVTAASCTTNCLAPVVKVMHEHIGILHGTMTTLHDLTNTQTLIDKGHKDLRRARASALSLIPTTTGSAKAIGEIFPELNGKLNGHAVRVPLMNASLTDFVFEARRPTTAEEVNSLLKAAAQGELKGILGYEELPLVSIDYKDDPRSAIVDAQCTLVIDSTQVKIMAWYDNEWGYSNRMMELAAKVARAM
ncbi:MAG: ArsJ-associated glyceraldehyde-3-phosphate dehydrogenase [Halothiobacillaceae bacterium]|nr:MAG: ArsJ-associated glyceraldehyde-3-phosphate dehydrogenase [Halothiobacillaceae bacterium]